MSRRKPPRLYLKEQDPPRSNAWYIRDGEKRISTGCREENLEGAQKALRDYIEDKYRAPLGLGGDLLVVEAVAAYLKDYAAHLRSRDFLFATAKPILEWWSGRKIREVNGTTCRGYVAWRTSHSYRGRKISDQTARHDLKTLRAALNRHKRECDPALVAPTVTLPQKASPRLSYY